MLFSVPKCRFPFAIYTITQSQIKRNFGYNFNGKVALITGGSSGMGYQFAETLLQNHVKYVALTDIDPKGETNAEKLGSQAMFFKANSAKKQELWIACQKTIHRFGGLDIVVNNAGMIHSDLPAQIIKLNCNGVVYGSWAGFDFMGKHRKGKGGVIVNISSIVGIRACAPTPIYSGTKHFVVGFVRSIGTPFYEKMTGVKVYCLCPGFTNTNLYTNYRSHEEFDGCEEYAKEFFTRITYQTPKNVAKAMIEVIKIGKNGSVWVPKDDKPPYEVQPEEPTIQ